MPLLKELFGTTEGLFSFGVIVFVLVIAIYIGRMAIQKMNQEPPAK